MFFQVIKYYKVQTKCPSLLLFNKYIINLINLLIKKMFNEILNF